MHAEAQLLTFRVLRSSVAAVKGLLDALLFLDEQINSQPLIDHVYDEVGLRCPAIAFACALRSNLFVWRALALLSDPLRSANVGRREAREDEAHGFAPRMSLRQAAPVIWFFSRLLLLPCCRAMQESNLREVVAVTRAVYKARHQVRSPLSRPVS